MCSSIVKGDDKFITTDYLQQCSDLASNLAFYRQLPGMRLHASWDSRPISPVGRCGYACRWMSSGVKRPQKRLYPLRLSVAEEEFAG
ncbi:hypothetical protein [Escherichia coli]|uniref:hypothetical protein n=1 Tax=Escherichia coli TaxID=562 RepID=UPI0021E11EE7|nr:hypothetical protein [Escherichia coli]